MSGNERLPESNEDNFELLAYFKKKFRNSRIENVIPPREQNVNNTNDMESIDVEHVHFVENPNNSNVIYSERVFSEVESDEDTKAAEDSRVNLDSILSALPESPAAEKEYNHPEFETAYSPKDEVIIDVPIDEKLLINTRALSKHAKTYELEKFKKNALLILNQTNIIGYKPRLGTEKDEAELVATFSKFGFEISVESDLNKAEIMRKLQEFGSQDFTEYGSVAIAVLTHGSKHGLIRARDQPYSELEIINHLKVDRNPTLLTKPKIVIIQACRGGEDIIGLMVFQSGKIRKDFDEEVEPYTLPVESDMLILHSSYIGKPSHRDEVHGSWFIQSLCGKINQLSSSTDMESILTEVKREVAIDRAHLDHNKRTFEMDINKQMPVVTSTLIRKLFLRSYGEGGSPLEAFTQADIPGGVDHSVLDNGSPNTPMLVQFGPCSCFLDHFNYLTNCLRHYLEDYPDDVRGRSLLDVATTFEESVEFNTAKERMLKAISLHLRESKANESEYFKYMYLYNMKHE